MKILNAYIESFGCFDNRSFDFSGGFDLIVGDNESGKSTLLTFIKFVLYGMPRKNQENSAERERSISAKTCRAAGSLLIELDGGEQYTVERRGILRLGEKRESYSEDCRIIDERTGAQVHKGAIPGELFLGAPMNVFESTALARQMKTSEIDSDGVGDALSNMLLSADESLDMQKALDRLDAVRKSLLHKSGRGGSLALLEDERASLSRRLETAKADRAEILAYTETVSDLKKSALARRRELDRLDDTFTAFNSISVLKRFESLHDHERKLRSIKVSIDDFKKKNTVDGLLPERDLASAADENVKSYRAAAQASRLADERLREAERAQKSYRPLSPNLSADEIRAMGGADAVCQRVDKLSSRSSGNKKMSMLAFVLALLLAVAGGMAAALMTEIPAVGISLCAAAAVVLTIGTVLFSSSKKLKKALADELEAVGCSYGDSAAEVRAYLSRAFEDELAANELNKARSLALSVKELRRSDLELAAAEAERILEKWRVSSSDDKTAALCETARRVREYYAELDSLEKELNLEKRAILSLSSELEAYNEPDLRARIPVGLEDGYSDSAMDELERRRRFCSTSLRSITEKQIEAERELIRLESESEDPARLAAALDDADKRYEEERLRYDSCVAAIDALTAAGANIRDSVTPVIRKISAGYLSAFTEGRYSSIGMENGCVAVSAEGAEGRAKIDNLSAGTRDAVYFSLRLSLMELLYKSEMPPLILDEALSQLDDKRAARVLAMLSEFCQGGRQCLLFTCHNRERALVGNSERVGVISL